VNVVEGGLSGQTLQGGECLSLSDGVLFPLARGSNNWPQPPSQGTTDIMVEVAALVPRVTTIGWTVDPLVGVYMIRYGSAPLSWQWVNLLGFVYR